MKPGWAISITYLLHKAIATRATLYYGFLLSEKKLTLLQVYVFPGAGIQVTILSDL